MKVLISGASGFLGRSLSEHLKENGHDVFHLVRHNEKSDHEIFWDPYLPNLKGELLEGFDGVIHLSGENVGNGLWTSAKKYRIYKSRLKSTRLLVKRLAQVKHKPKLFICASGVGCYADSGDQWVTEASEKGYGFFPDLCTKWEAEAAKIEKVGVRRVSLRTGMVLAKKGGALKSIARPTALGLGAILGSGEQYMSWIHLADWIKLINFALESDITGPINAVAPNPVTNKEFTQRLAKTLKRPVFLKFPDLFLRIGLGEMGSELLLKSLRIKSDVLAKAGFVFDAPDLQTALNKEYSS